MDLVLDLYIICQHGRFIIVHLLNTVHLVQNIRKPLSLQQSAEVRVFPSLIDQAGTYRHILPLGLLPGSGGLIFFLRLVYLVLFLDNLLLLLGDLTFLDGDLTFLGGNLILLQADTGHGIDNLCVQVINLLLQNILLALQFHNLVRNTVQKGCALIDLALNIGYAGSPGRQRPQALLTDQHCQQTYG